MIFNAIIKWTLFEIISIQQQKQQKQQQQRRRRQKNICMYNDKKNLKYENNYLKLPKDKLSWYLL